MDFQPMSPEELQQAMQFLLRQQTQFAADISSMEGQWTMRFDRLVDQTDRLTDSLGQLAAVQQHTDEQLNELTGGLLGLTRIVGQLAAAQQRTDEQLREMADRVRETDAHLKEVGSHLDIVITMFERHLRDDHGHGPS